MALTAISAKRRILPTCQLLLRVKPLLTERTAISESHDRPRVIVLLSHRQQPGPVRAVYMLVECMCVGGEPLI